MVFEDKNYNLVVFLGVVMTVLTSLWAFFNDIEFGKIYIGLFLTPVALLFILTLLVKESDKKGVLARLKFPLSTSPGVSAIMLGLGWVGFSLIQFVGGFLSFSLTSFMIPLTAQESTIFIQQTATQLSITTSQGMQLFITTMIASFLEEFIFGWVGITIAFVLIAFILEEIISQKVGKDTKLIISFVFLGIIFASLHTFNKTYGQFAFNDFQTWQPYIVATVFRLVMNGFLYYSGAFLSFLIGFHQANNFFWYYNEFGATATKDALMSFPGALMILYFGLMIWIIVKNFNNINKVVASIMKGVRNGGRSDL